MTATQSLHHIREDCLRRLMEAICYYNFPVCLPTNSIGIHNQVIEDSGNLGDKLNNHLMQTRYLCRQDCEMVMQNECGSTYNYLEENIMHELPGMIMNCARLPVHSVNDPLVCRRIGKPLLISDQNFQQENKHEFWKPSLSGPASSELIDKKLPQKPGDVNYTLLVTPDLLPIFISFGALALLGIILLIVCFYSRRNTSNRLVGLQGVGEGFLSRPKANKNCHLGQSQSHSEMINNYQIREQGVGAPNDLNTSQKRRVPGMGAGAKLNSTNGLLNGFHEGLTTAYKSNIGTCNMAETNTVSAPTAIGQMSISSGLHNNIELTSSGPNSLINPNRTTYYQYQAANLMTPKLPPPRAPAPPPPPPLSGVQMVLQQNMTTQSYSQPISMVNNSIIPSLTIQSSYPQINGDLMHENLLGFESKGDADSPAAYTTLRNASPNEFVINEQTVSITSISSSQNNVLLPKVSLDKQNIKATEYPISQLRFGKQFGQGVFGAVYKAELLPNNAYENGIPLSVIVKTLSAGSPASLQANFCREANLISELDHPNVLGLLGISLQHPPWCMIFEIRQYLDLCELLASRRSIVNQINLTNITYPSNISTSVPHPLSESEIWRILSQVVSGMDYLSSHRFVHRDLAARNVLILNDQLYCKITDLGLARDCYANDYYRLHPHSLMLPIRWMPLDSIIFGKFSVESDIWAFGVLMWEVWSGGMRPYSSFSDPEVLDLIRAKQLLPCPLQCPTNVYMFMTSCWNEELENRPTFKDCLNQLQRLHCDTPTTPLFYPTKQQLGSYLQTTDRYDRDYQFQDKHENLSDVSRSNHSNTTYKMNNYTICSKDYPNKYDITETFDGINYLNNNVSPDGMSINENNKSVPSMYTYIPNLNSMTSSASPHLNNCETNGLEMRLLPNTMYLSTLNPVT